MKSNYNNKFVSFWDMSSGGSKKENFMHCYIECDNEQEAKVIFYNRFGHNPERVTCTCCGEDYAIYLEENLYQATGHHRGCKYESGLGYTEVYKGGIYCEYQTIEQFVNRPDVMVILKEDIKDFEREGELPSQGYVWVD